ncbi:MAG: hypothetical protein WBM46_11135 [Polyangiales bacterium]
MARALLEEQDELGVPWQRAASGSEDRMTDQKGRLWLLAIVMGIGACDGTAIFIPEDNTRVYLSSGSSAPYYVHVLLDETEHAWALDPNNDVGDVFLLESYDDSYGGWKPAPVPPPQYTGSPVYLPTGTSYWWRFSIDLYALGIYAEPGTWGGSFMFRVFFKNATDAWQPIPGLTVAWQECLRMLEAGETSCPYTYEVRLRSQYYVPNITLGKTDCAYGAPDCSRCVPHIEYQAARIFSSGAYYALPGFVEFTFGSPNAGAHNQGIARFADVVVGGQRYTRVASSYNNSKGFSFSTFETFTEEDSWLANTEQARLDIRQELNHPGGMQAHGDLVVIAMEHSGSSGGFPPAQVRFVRVTGDPTNPLLEEVNRLALDGSQGELWQANQSSAATAGFVTLKSGYFLLAVAGSGHGKQGVWFYESSDTWINEYTTWNYVDTWDPPCTGWGKPEHCWGGAGGVSSC